jgi:hypothetical protein
MSFEVVHTSVVRGLRGESGFATAIVTRGLPAGLESGLQDVSGYDHDETRAIGVDTVEWAHRIVTVRGRPYTVLSRIAPNGVDASRRPNRIAHHLVLEPHDRAAGGPAWMLGQHRAFETGTPAVEERSTQPSLPKGSLTARPARAWEAAGFDAGWAGVVAQTILDAPQSTIYVVLPEPLDALPLVIDVMALLPEDRRWHVTFSTRPLVTLPQVRCQLRFVRANAPGLARLLADPSARTLHVEHDLGAGEGRAAEAARRGEVVEPTVRAPSLKVHPVIDASTSAASPSPAKVPEIQTPQQSVHAPSPPVPPQPVFAGALLAAEESTRTRTTHPVPAVAYSSASESTTTSWPVLAVFLIGYSVVAIFGALVLFILAASGR